MGSCEFTKPTIVFLLVIRSQLDNNAFPVYDQMNSAAIFQSLKSKDNKGHMFYKLAKRNIYKSSYFKRQKEFYSWGFLKVAVVSV